jgi:hypothetical protein
MRSKRTSNSTNSGRRPGPGNITKTGKKPSNKKIKKIKQSNTARTAQRSFNNTRNRKEKILYI